MITWAYVYLAAQILKHKGDKHTEFNIFGPMVADLLLAIIIVWGLK